MTLAKLTLSIVLAGSTGPPINGLPRAGPTEIIGFGPSATSAAAVTPMETKRKDLSHFVAQPVSWSRLVFRASKLMLTATAEVSLTEAASPLPPELDKIIEEELEREQTEVDSLLRLQIHTKLFNRRSDSFLWLDPKSGAALQRTQVDLGRRKRLKTYRFGKDGIRSYRVVPATPAERELAPRDWTQKGESFYPYAPAQRGPHQRETVIEPGSLLYLISAFEPEAFRHGQRLLTFANKAVHLVDIRWTGTTSVSTRYEVLDSTGRSVGKSKSSKPNLRKTEALVYSVDATPPSGEHESDFELLGLEGDIELLLEPERRIPIQLRGRLPPVGRIVVRLKQVHLRHAD